MLNNCKDTDKEIDSNIFPLLKSNTVAIKKLSWFIPVCCHHEMPGSDKDPKLSPRTEKHCNGNVFLGCCTGSLTALMSVMS